MFTQLSLQNQIQYRKICREMVRLALRYPVPIIYAPPLNVGGEPKGGTGCVVELDCRSLFVTSLHIYKAYADRVRNGERLNWQIGALPPLDPIPRVVLKDVQRDVVFLEVSRTEGRSACGDYSWVYSPATAWPPREPQIGELLLISGYPKALRMVGARSIKAGPCSAMFRVTTRVNGHGCFACQIGRDDLISFDDQELPPPDTDFGGWSGSPVFLVENLVYTLVGLVNEYSPLSSVLFVSSLAGIEVSGKLCR
jgi:hypothetical protein